MAVGENVENILAELVERLIVDEMAQMGERTRILASDGEQRLVGHDAERGDAQILRRLLSPCAQGKGPTARGGIKIGGEVAAWAQRGHARGSGCTVGGTCRRGWLLRGRPANGEFGLFALGDAKPFGRQSNEIRSIGRDKGASGADE